MGHEWLSKFLRATVTSVLLVGCSVTPAITESQRLQARAAYDQGVAHLSRGEWAGALTAFRQASTLDPEVATYRNALGISLLQLGQPQLALVEFDRAVKADTGYADAYLNQGIAYAEMQRWPEAVQAYQRAILLPRLTAHDIAHQNLGLAFYHLGRYVEAEGALRFALGLDPEMEAAWYHLGLVLLRAGRQDDARKAFMRTRDLAPDSPFGQAAAERLKAIGGGG